jgi:uncharacterized protein with ParB-like and HNH nuclease domain
VSLPFFAFLTISDTSRPETKQVGLIDSILRNYYIPPIIFGTLPLYINSNKSDIRLAVDTAADGGELRTCIDGKQRLTSIQR